MVERVSGVHDPELPGSSGPRTMRRTEDINPADIQMVQVVLLRFSACAHRPGRKASMGEVNHMCGTGRGSLLPCACLWTPVGDAGGAHVPARVGEDAWTALSRITFPASTSWSHATVTDSRPRGTFAHRHIPRSAIASNAPCRAKAPRRQGVKAPCSVTASHVSHVPASETMTTSSSVRDTTTEYISMHFK
jgi:hypothetical protein